MSTSVMKPLFLHGPFTLLVIILIHVSSGARITSSNDEWSVPLFLWQTVDSPVYHTALLPEHPPFYVDDPSKNSNNSWSKVFDDPLCYATRFDDAQAPYYPLVTLKVYYSEERNDFQTTTSSLSELNRFGDNYQYLDTIGCIRSTPGAGYEASQFVPLTISYDDATADSVTAPLSYEDLNILLLPPEQIPKSYRQGSITGFASRSNCSICSIGMSESFPSAGGPDCAYECNDYGKHFDECFISSYDISSMDTDAAKAFVQNMEIADSVILKYGDATVTPLSPGTHVHLSFNYFCCYSKEDKHTIRSVLQKYNWPAINITYGEPVWRIDSDANQVDHYSMIVLLNEESETIMQNLIEDVEAAVRAEGIDVHIPRAQQEPFHSTLGVVSGKNFPAIAALQSVNEVVPPGTWNSAGPITLSKPDF